MKHRKYVETLTRKKEHIESPALRLNVATPMLVLLVHRSLYNTKLKAVQRSPVKSRVYFQMDYYINPYLYIKVVLFHFSTDVVLVHTLFILFIYTA